jgi:hypothetical protein
MLCAFLLALGLTALQTVAATGSVGEAEAATLSRAPLSQRRCPGRLLVVGLQYAGVRLRGTAATVAGPGLARRHPSRIRWREERWRRGCGRRGAVEGGDGGALGAGRERGGGRLALRVDLASGI